MSVGEKDHLLDGVPGKRLYSLILAGGSGTRLWPLSREEMPKQFLTLCGHTKSLLQQTVDRTLSFSKSEHTYVIASPRWKALIDQQVGMFLPIHSNLILESEGRNTAPAIALALATLLLEGAEQEDYLLVCPSDHLIANQLAFEKAVACAKKRADLGDLVVFGIKPTSPETGFGYIKVVSKQETVSAVEAFVEKPDSKTAHSYLESGEYFWNSGIFCFRIGDMVRALCHFFPESNPLFSVSLSDLEAVFTTLPKISIDYAVMEKAQNISCVMLDAGWSDVGSWDAVYENSHCDTNENALLGDVLLKESGKNLIIGDSRLICGVDLHSMVVVDTPDALFLSPRASSQKLRDLVAVMASEKRKELIDAPSSARPWGIYRVLADEKRHKIKRIVVDPGKRLSLQYHFHRSEHWIVVQGTARVLVCEQEERELARPKLVHEGESIFVPKGQLHRLENPGKIPLEIIEVQIGEYVGEDDIIRVDDDFSRQG